MTTRLRIPEGWTTRGALPALAGSRPTASEAEDLTEDLLYVTDPDRIFAIDIGWYPELDPEGDFIGRVIASDDWESPVEEFCTKDLRELVGWAQSWFDDVLEQIGQPGRHLGPEAFAAQEPSGGEPPLDLMGAPPPRYSSPATSSFAKVRVAPQ